MVAIFQEIQPIDEYVIQIPQPFTDQDRKLLLLLYQPLIEPTAVSLLFTLWADGEDEQETYNHYHLMNVLSMPLKPIFQARISLEAIGLLRTFVKNEEHKRSFIYELSPPLHAKQFFDDPLLSTFLYSKIGEQSYRSVRDRLLPARIQKNGYEEVSRTFLDVYKPVNKQAAVEEIEDWESPSTKQSSIPFYHDQFDFELMYAGLSEQMVPKSSLQAVSKETISKTAFLYSLNPLDMQKVIMMALDENLQLTEERLRKSAAEFYKMNTSSSPPVMQKVFARPVTVEEVKQMTREEKLIHYLEHTAPAQMLRDLTGKEPLPVDVQLAERLINTHELPIGVVNVLLQYVFIRNEGRITNRYVERIASHWLNQDVSSAKEALMFSRKEHDQYVKWKEEEQTKPSYRGKPTREEIVPEWFKQQGGQTESKKTSNKKEAPQTKFSNKELEERRRKLREELRKPRKGVK